LSLSTHVLDATRGRPAAGVDVALERGREEAWDTVAAGVTDADGRHRFADAAGGELALEHATYRLSFGTGAYFQATGQGGFYPRVDVTFAVTEPDAHHHVPLLVSPFAYSTYKGS
jgi:5-hydroxyisourate hydrolase